MPVTGIPQQKRTSHALVGARIVVSPDATIEKGTILIRGGTITAVGPDVAIPDDARTWNLEGKTIYPGLLDAFGELPAESVPPAVGVGYWNQQITPQARADSVWRPDPALNAKLRSQGICLRLVAPPAGIIKGTSCIVTTSDADPSRAVLLDRAAMHVRLSVNRQFGRSGYPGSPMGAMTLARQAFYDADWYRRAWQAFESGTSSERPEQNDALNLLQAWRESRALFICDASDELYFLRADQVAREFDLNLVVRGSGQEYQRLDAVRSAGRAVLLPVEFPRPPQVATPEAALGVSLESLMHWDLAPENPARVDQAGVKFALTTDGLTDVAGFLAAVRKAVDRGLPAASALRAVTTAPAEILGLERKVGTIEAGKMANLVLTDGDLFASSTKIVEAWVDGERFEIDRPLMVDPRGTWELKVSPPADPTAEPAPFILTLEGEPNRLRGKIGQGNKEEKLISATLEQTLVGCTFKGDAFSSPGVVRLSGQITGALDQPAWSGLVEFPDGRRSTVTGGRIKKHDPSPEKKPSESPAPAAEPPGPPAGTPAADSPVAPPQPPAAGEPTPTDQPNSAPADKPPPQKADEPKNKKALFEPNFPLGDYGRAAAPELPRLVVFQNGVIWTCTGQGVIEGGMVIVQDGRILAVGRNLPVPEGALAIDLNGRHLTPGVIDCHSHSATDGGVNEGGQAITAEVRIGDFVDPNDLSIYRQLAGGVTAINILHGSANPIGGQNQVCRMKWGALPEEMKFQGAPPGIKFALGENVKQSNSDRRPEDVPRYPQTRMGVEQIIRDEFQRAREYQARWDSWNNQPVGTPPRVDLELQAVSEILAGQRKIHCHSYRQDEILAFLRVCEEYDVRVATLQHILEGYKVADVMARHGAGGSSFSDWWAYKMEVYDSIPYNGALMHEAGVVVSFNSDDAELARRLNLEAAKAVKYGGVPPEEALKFVTLNPARQLGIDGRVGSIEPGKDADLAVWSRSPLSSFTRCEQTWVEGRKYFDRDLDRETRDENRRMKATLIQRVLESAEQPAREGEGPRRSGDEWPDFDEADEPNKP
jgi:N-acetylglucosamine-6-phosphate deacetylase